MHKVSLDQKLKFLAELDKLKQVMRVNLLQDGSRRENTAEHSWHMSLMVILLAEYAAEPIDVLKAVKMALIHDVVEIDAGDTYAFDAEAHNDKEDREQRAAERLFGLLPEPESSEFRILWEEYEALRTPESRFVQAMDRLSPFMQHMGNQGKTWREKKMTKKLLMTRMQTIYDYCPNLASFMEDSINAALAKGWLSQE